MAGSFGKAQEAIQRMWDGRHEADLTQVLGSLPDTIKGPVVVPMVDLVAAQENMDSIREGLTRLWGICAGVHRLGDPVSVSKDDFDEVLRILQDLL